jgi:hypothetical protein
MNRPPSHVRSRIVGAALARGWRPEFRGQRRKILTGVRGARRDIDQRAHFWIGAGLADDHAGIGMPDQNRRSVLQRQRAPGRGDIVGEGRQRPSLMEEVAVL